MPINRFSRRIYKGHLKLIMTVYLDDNIESYFEKRSEKIPTNFESKKEQYLLFHFAGETLTKTMMSNF